MHAIRVAAVQATPVVFNREATVDKACRLIAEAGAAGARLVVFPEVFVAAYPNDYWVKECAHYSREASQALIRLWKESMERDGPAMRRLQEAAQKAGAWVVMGFNERELERPGTIYNSLVFIDDAGQIRHLHRKVMPTLQERLAWGFGRGDDIQAVAAPWGRMGALICWENYMPLARYTLYDQGIEIYMAPTYEDSDLWQASMRHISFESGCFVITTVSYVRTTDYPEDFELRAALQRAPETEIRGGTAIIAPGGRYLAGPLFEAEGILYADLEMDEILHSRRLFDAVGHYSRSDRFRLAQPGAAAPPAMPVDGTGGNGLTRAAEERARAER